MSDVEQKVKLKRSTLSKASKTAVKTHVRKARGQGKSRYPEIVGAARQLFAQGGYEAATMRNIAEAVGLTTTGIYVYFPDKEAILTALAQATFVDLIAALETAAKVHGDAVKAFEAELRAYVEFGVKRPDEYRLAFMAKNIAQIAPGRPSKSGANPEAMGRSFRYLQDKVSQLMDAGRIRRSEPQLIAETVWAMLHGLVALQIDHPGYPVSGEEQVLGELVSQILRGLGAVI